MAFVGLIGGREGAEDVELMTTLAFWIMGGLAGLFLVRPELWRRLWFDRVDPRPAALMRIAFGLVVAMTFVDLLMPHPPLEYSMARFLFTDEGLWLTDLARKSYGEDLRTLWDPDHGFEHGWEVFSALWGSFTILHIRSDPSMVFTIYGCLLVAVAMMIVGFRTRVATLVVFVAAEMLYRYSPVFYTGGDTVIRVFLFLGVLTRWGEAYSVDSWRRRKREILAGAGYVPALRRIPAWPLRLMMLQLACIYCATGFLKSGPTWTEGTALYYALNLDHFYRWPQSHPVTVAQYLGVLPLATWGVRWWEILFPIAVVGAAVRAYERDRSAGLWPEAAAWRRGLGVGAFAVAWCAFAYVLGVTAYHHLGEESMIPLERRVSVITALVAVLPIVVVATYRVLRSSAPRAHRIVLHWVLGRRLWLGLGFAMHVGIDLGMNVGTFAEVMMSVYLAWLTGPEIERAWRFVARRPLRPGEGARPRRSRWARWLLAPLDRLRFRVDPQPFEVLHAGDEPALRRAALLRPWDLWGRLRFVHDDAVAGDRLHVRLPGGDVLHGNRAAAALTAALPGLLWLRPFAGLPGVGGLARRILGQ
jgi:uncharacterized membrane protein YphA (DoxX/SURF4 family)